MPARVLVAGVALVALQAWATPGAVDRNGCHKSQAAGIHCHPERAAGSGGADGTQAARDRRLTRECRGRPNSGACLGYAKP